MLIKPECHEKTWQNTIEIYPLYQLSQIQSPQRPMVLQYIYLRYDATEKNYWLWKSRLKTLDM